MQKQDQKQMKLRYNPKCVVASGLVVGSYWLLAPSDRRVSVALALAVATYAGLAHYDRLYNCDERLQSFGGPVSVITGPFKPALDADNRYTGRGATPAPKLAGLWCPERRVRLKRARAVCYGRAMAGVWGPRRGETERPRTAHGVL